MVLLRRRGLFSPAMTTPKLTPHDVRAVSVKAKVSPQAVQNYLNGGRVRMVTADAVSRALTDLGFGHLVPNAPKTPEVLPAA